MYKVIKYGCDFCKGEVVETTDKNEIIEHEKECWFNPVNKHCCSCEHFVEGEDKPCDVRTNNCFERVFDESMPCVKWEKKENK